MPAIFTGEFKTIISVLSIPPIEKVVS
jgi:hypothetical protein